MRLQRTARFFGGLLTLLATCPCLGVRAQTVVPEIDSKETTGERPYEMVWAKRVEPGPPTVRFDQLAGWTLQVEGGAEAVLQVTRTQNVWDRPVARLRYRGDGKTEGKPRIVLKPPQPVALPDNADAVDLWLYGNRWNWENPPGTPSVHIILHFQDGQGAAQEFEVDRVRWQEWWLAHKRLPREWKAPLRLQGIEISGGWQPEWREVFFDSFRFYREELPPLQFTARPKRPLTLPEGQTVGVNTGEGKLPFPTREETILPIHLSTNHIQRVRSPGDLTNGVAEFQYQGDDCSISYTLSPRQGLGSLRAAVNGQSLGLLMDGFAVRTPAGPTNPAPTAVKADKDRLTLEYSDGTIYQVHIWHKSLVVDVINRTGEATDLNLGQLAGLTEPRTVWVPYLNYGGGAHPCVLLSRAGTNQVFTSLWLDWFRSNGSEPYAAESVATNSARINGGVRYLACTDGRRNPMFERLFITVSPVFEEVLPSIPNPVGTHAAEAVDCLWQESWGPENYEAQMKRSRTLRAYGIENLIQCNHEIAWRDGGESFTLRVRAAPRKGGDEALQRYVAHQRSLGWFAGLYSNYTDFAPVNEFWSPDGVQRQSDGNWRTAWPRCYAEKPLKAVEFDALLAPQIKAKYNPNSAYTDVHTAVAPWGYTDFDARVPGAGTFAQTLYAYGELLRNDSRVYGGPIFSEGTYQWLYAGLADGNYALAYDGRPLAKEPLLPVFDLYQIHPKECDIGMGWTANFCDPIPDWRKPENIDRSIDRFLLHTLAYGHIGWLVEEEHGLARVFRSYYMLQQVQARYGLQAPSRIAYWDGTNLVSVSEGVMRDLPRSRRQLFVEYPSGLQLWLNDHPTENWSLPPSDIPGLKLQTNALVLPPAGWAACSKDGQLASYSGLDGPQRVDYLRSPAYTYLDGRGHWFNTAEASGDSPLALRSTGERQITAIRAPGAGPFVVRRPFQIQGACVECQAYDVDGQRLAAPTFRDAPAETRVEPVEKAIRYVLGFTPPQ